MGICSDPSRSAGVEPRLCAETGKGGSDHRGASNGRLIVAFQNENRQLRGWRFYELLKVRKITVYVHGQ